MAAYSWQHNQLSGGAAAAQPVDDDGDDTTDHLLRPKEDLRDKQKATSGGSSVAQNTNLLKVLKYLKAHSRRAPGRTLHEIDQALSKQKPLGLAEGSLKTFLETQLEGNEKIHSTPRGGEAGYSFIPAFPDVHDKASLCREINAGHGIPIKRFEDDQCYEELSDDIKSLVRCGDIMAAKSEEPPKQLVLYPRGMKFLVSVGEDLNSQRGGATTYQGDACLYTNRDLRQEIRRGDAIGIAEATASPEHATWFRICSSLNGKQSKWAQAPESVSSVKDLDKDRHPATTTTTTTAGAGLTSPAGELDGFWAEKFTENELPLDQTADTAGPHSLFKFGCTNDVRRIWQATAEKMPRNGTDLDRELKRRNMLGPDVAQRRQRITHEKKRRKPRMAKSSGLTNSHI